MENGAEDTGQNTVYGIAAMSLLEAVVLTLQEKGIDGAGMIVEDIIFVALGPIAALGLIEFEERVM